MINNERFAKYITAVTLVLHDIRGSAGVFIIFSKASCFFAVAIKKSPKRIKRREKTNAFCSTFTCFAMINYTEISNVSSSMFPHPDYSRLRTNVKVDAKFTMQTQVRILNCANKTQNKLPRF